MKDNIQLNEEQVSLLREKELELLILFISVCEQLQLKYFAVEGTLLGAVRHHGFIPWDDDIDVGMLRADYERFVKEAPSLLPEGFFLQTHSSEPAYPHCFAKLRNSRTEFRETASKDLPINHGIYIDIFPFDDYPENRMKGKLFDLEKLLIRYRVREIYYIPSDRKLTPVNAVRRLLKLLARCRYKTVEDALLQQEKLIKSFPSSTLVINNGSPWGNRERVPAKWLEKTVPLEFEGLTIAAPADYDRYLTHVYGDYMTLPPEEERVPHHYLCAIRFDGGLNEG